MADKPKLVPWVEKAATPAEAALPAPPMATPAAGLTGTTGVKKPALVPWREPGEIAPAAGVTAGPLDLSRPTQAGVPGVAPAAARPVLRETLKRIDQPGGLDRAAEAAVAFHQNAQDADRLAKVSVGDAAVAALAGAQGVGNWADEQARWLLPDVAVDFIEGGTKWTLSKGMGVADIPRAYAWKAAANAGALLPDSDSEYGKWLSDKTGAFLAAAGDIADLVTDPTGIMGDATAGVVNAMGIPIAPGAGDEDQYARAVEEAGRRLYNAFADGALATRAVTHVSDVGYDLGDDIGGYLLDGDSTVWHPSQLSTEDLLDIVLPKAEAERLALTATKPIDSTFWSMLATNTGRAGADLLVQMVADPLWFTGVAEGSKLVAAGDSMARASLSVVQDVAAVARRTGQDEVVLITQLANDAAHGTATARTTVQNAVNSAKLGLASPAGQTAKQLRVLEEDLRRATRLLDDLDNGTLSKRLVKEGTGRYVIPGDEVQRYVFPAGGAVDKLSQQVGMAAAYMVSPFNQEVLELTADAIAMGRIPDTMTSGQKLALWGARTVRGVWEVPAYAWEVAGRMFGSRSFHAAYIPAGLKVRGYQLISPAEVVKQANKAGRPVGKSAALNLARKVTASNPQEWATYVGALEDASSGLVARKAQLLHDVMNITREARRVYDERKAAGTLPPGHTVANIMTEAADLIDRGAGLAPEYLAAHPDMQRVVAATASLFQQVEQAAGVTPQQARQALQAMERNIHGSFTHYDEINNRIAALIPGANLWEDPAGILADIQKGFFNAKVAFDDAVQHAATATARAQQAQQRYHKTRAAADAAEQAARTARDEWARAANAANAADADAAAKAADAAAKTATAAAADATAQAADAAAKAAKVGTGGLDEIAAKAAAIKFAAAMRARDDYASGLKFIASGRQFVKADLDTHIGRDTADLLRRMQTDGLLRAEPTGGFRLHPEVLDALRGRPYTRHGSGPGAAGAAAAEAAARAARATSDAARDAADRAARAAAAASSRARDAADAMRAAAQKKTRARAAAGKKDAGAQAAEDAFRTAIDDLAKAPTPAAVQALKQTMDDYKTLFDVTESAERPQLPKFTGELRDLTKWERHLYRKFRKQTDAAGFDANQRMQAAVLMLRDEAPLPKDFVGVSPPMPSRQGPGGWNLEYDQMMGQRLPDLDPQMKPLVDLTRDLIKRYEDAYRMVGLGEIVKNPLDRFRQWGTVGYTPHVRDASSALQRGKLMSATATGDYRPVSDLDARLSTDMDARRRRTLAGTLSEINAADGAATLSINPDVLLSRYSQANQAITSTEFIMSMIQRGVAKVMTPAEAAKQDYVPVLSRHERNRAWDTLVMGERGWHGAFTPQELATMRTALQQGKVAEGDSFAAWVSEIPEVRRAHTIERALVELNLARWDAGDVALQAGDSPLRQVLDLHNAGKARQQDWDEVANWLNDEYHALIRARNGDEATVVAGRTTGDWLRDYYTTDLRQLHVPADVVQNMDDAFNITSQMFKEGSFGDKVKKLNDALNNMAKLRLTIINLPFHAKNLLWNTFTNIVDIGPLGALNPMTQRTAGRIAWAAYYQGKYGTLEEAWRVLSEGRRSGEALRSYTARLWSRATFQSMVKKTMDDGIDLGDGVTRKASEAIAELERAGVLTGAYTDYNDINLYQQGLAELYATEGISTIGTTARTAAEYGEYAVEAALVAAITGTPPITVLPKTAGQNMANYVENVTRAANFVGNMKRSGSFADSAAHVSKYLFNYDDLTAFQKVWMRSIFMFYSWPMKNLQLHAALLAEKPVYYAMLNTALVTEGPDLIDAIRHDSQQTEKSGDNFFHRARNTAYQQSLLYPQEEARFRVPTLRSDNIYAAGLGSPVEAAMDQARNVTAFASGDPRIIGAGSWLIKTTYEGLTDQSLHYGKSYQEANSGVLIGQILAGLSDRADEADEMGASYAGELFRYFRDSVAASTGWKQVNGAQVIDPFAAKVLGNFWWRPVLSNAAAMTDAYHLAMQDQTVEGATDGMTQLSPYEKAADALLGMSFVQVDEQKRAASKQHEKKNELLDIFIERNIVNRHELVSPEK